MAFLLVVGCSATEPGKTVDPHDHDPMPETNMPLTQTTEEGAIFELHFDASALGAAFAVEGEYGILAASLLPRPASRAAVLVRLNVDQTPNIEVEPGWSNGQTGRWKKLETVWTEGNQRVLAADLETAATTLRVRIATADLPTIESVRFTANVPLENNLRSGALEQATPRAGSTATPRTAWNAQSARCGTPNDAAKLVVLRRTIGTNTTHEHLRGLQALALEGLGYCDVRSNEFVANDQTAMGRGPRRGAIAPVGADNQGRISVAVLGCDADVNLTANIKALLDELTAIHGFTSAAQFVVEDDGLCTTDDAWLDGALATWLVDAPFVVVPPPPPPPPPPTHGTIQGQVLDMDTGSPIDGAMVSCTDCPPTSTDISGNFVIEVPAGDHTLTVTKTMFLDGTATVPVVAGESVAVTVALAPEPRTPGVSVIDHSFLITHFGGTDADPFTFPETQEGFQQYLDAVGVTYFAAWEYVVPNNQTVANNCGLTILLPERGMWRRAGALGLLADRLRMLVNEPVTLRNWWRPPCYNQGVGGAANGDHPDGDALDLDFRSARSRADAQRFLCETYWNQDIVAPEDIEPGSNLNPRLNMSVGLGGVTIHLGLLSRNGRRFWQYSSYTTETNSGNCW